MRRLLVILGALSALVLGTLVVGTTAAGAATKDVVIVDDSFQAQTVTVTQGDTVKWTDNGNESHTVTADNGSFDSSAGGSAVLAKGQTFSATFNTPGSFAYHCKIHGGPGGVGMSGTIVVKAASAPATTAAPPTTSKAVGPTTPPTTAMTATAPPATVQGSGSQMSQTPSGAPNTGGGSTSGVQDIGLLGLGGGLIMAAGTALVMRKRLSTTN